MRILAMICNLAMIVCWIMVVVKMFQNLGVIGLLGLLCPLWAFIWGWMNSAKVGKNLMLAWTALWILGMVLTFASGGYNYSLGTTP